jgi:Rrf2 family protein
LEITRRADLATRALLALHRRGGKTKAADLAGEVGTTPGFLSHAMTPLIGRGWVRSEPGPTGGYRLIAPLDDISVLQVIETIEGTTDTERCVLEDRPCSGAGPCALHQPWAKARNRLLGELDRTTLATLARRSTPR